MRKITVLELRSVRGTGGGPEKTILRGAALANRARFDVKVCYLRDERDPVFGVDRQAAGLGIDYVEVRERHSFDHRIWSQLVSVVRSRRIDIVHAHDYKTNFLAWLLARSTGILPMSTSHGWTGNSKRELWVYYPADKKLVARFPQAIAVSSDIRQQLITAGANPARVTLVLNAIDADVFRRDPALRQTIRQSLGFGPDDVVIGSVGRVERQKRFDLLIDCFARLAASHPTLRLVIVGDGALRPELQRLAGSLGVGDRCLLLGHRRDITELHHAFDLFVQSSEYEGTPNAVLEAMALETPILATDAGGTREIVESGVHGLIVPIRDAAALSSGITEMLASPSAAAARAIAARRRVETTLSFEARTRRLEAIYEAIIGERDNGSLASHDPSKRGAYA